METPLNVTYDLNVLVDVYQEREPYFQDSREALNWATSEQVHGIFPAHGLTTLHYLLEKDPGQITARRAVEFVLLHLEIAGVDKEGFRRALRSSVSDFEDAVVAETATRAGSRYIITRNLEDFEHSAVEAISPTAFLERMAELQE